MIGKVLAQYQICEQLGEGGMGVVWKAWDTHLDRFVALKTLPPERLADAERKRRSVQEAKAASSLNHPNIVHIYDIAEADGIQFISMEYVPGKTLDQLIGRRGLRLNEALKYAVQIADALAQTHLAGIIHRDLKPSNIIVSENGHVKVLDFGLAKLTEISTGEFGQTATMRAQNSPRTGEGMICGTVAYMSPEQAEGKKVDARSDIFSFGSMLYEMVTGRQAFHGDSKLSTLSAILKDDPKPVSGVIADTPRDLEKVIIRCLRKDPGRRFQHMADIKVALEELKEESDSGKLTSIVAQRAPGPVKSRRMLALAGIAVLLIVVMAVGLWFLRPRSHPIPKTVPLTSYPGSQITPAFSPDGKQVAFAWDGENGNNFDVYVKMLDAGAPLRLTSNPAGEYFPAWSPDNRHIAFSRAVADHVEIWTVPALGGAERKLGESSRLGGLSWAPNGKFLALGDQQSSQGPYHLVLLAVETGERRTLTSPPNRYFGDLGPKFSPDGKTMAFRRASSAVTADLYVLPINADGTPGGGPVQLTSRERVFDLDWTADGKKIVFSSDHSGSIGLWTVPASGGVPERLTVGSENAFWISVSRSGNRLVYARGLSDSNIWRVAGPNSSDRNSPPTKLIASTQQDFEPQYSPDGKKIVFSSNRSGNYELWICDAAGRDCGQLTFLNGPIPGSPRWSPDSSWVAFDCPKAGNSDIYVVSSDGGLPRQVTTESSADIRPSWSRDGRWIYFGSNRGGDWQIWKSPTQGGQAVQVTSAKGAEEAFESLDRQFVYYAKLNLPGIWKIPVEGGRETRVLEQGQMSLWTLGHDGICFFDVTQPAGLALKFYSFATRQTNLLRQFSQDTRTTTDDSSISVSTDGRWILYTQFDQVGSDLMLVEDFR